MISAQKANTANAFSLQNNAGNESLDRLALSTVNLWLATQPSGSLFGLQFSNPVHTEAPYRGNPNHFGKENDPMTGYKAGGVNVFGGGLGLYDEEDNLLGALGVSGDTSCADHNITWRTHDALNLGHVPTGLPGVIADNIIFDLDADGKSAGSFGHPTCGGNEQNINATDILVNHPIGSQ